MKYLSLARLYSEYKQRYKKQMRPYVDHYTLAEQTFHDFTPYERATIVVKRENRGYSVPTMMTTDKGKTLKIKRQNPNMPDTGWIYTRNVSIETFSNYDFEYEFIDCPVTTNSYISKDYFGMVTQLIYQISMTLFDNDDECDIYEFIEQAAIESDTLTDEIKSTLLDTSLCSTNLTAMKRGWAFLNINNKHLATYFRELSSDYYINVSDILSILLLKNYTPYSNINYEDLANAVKNMPMSLQSTEYLSTDENQQASAAYYEYKNLTKQLLKKLTSEAGIIPVTEYNPKDELENPKIVLELKNLTWT